MSEEQQAVVSNDNPSLENSQVEVASTTSAQETQNTTTSTEHVEKEQSLDELLQQFDIGNGDQEATTAQPAVEQQRDDSAERLAALENKIYETEYQRDMNNLTTVVRGDMDSSVFDDNFVETWINAEAQKDPKLQAAWKARNENPSAFNKVAKALGAKLKTKFSSLPDANATEDHAAVTEAVRGGTAKVQEAAPNYGAMTNNQFAEDAEKKYGIII